MTRSQPAVTPVTPSPLPYLQSKESKGGTEKKKKVGCVPQWLRRIGYDETTSCMGVSFFFFG